MVISALESTELALECGLRKDQIIISCKVSRPAQPHRRLPRAVAPDRPAAAPRPHRGRHGHEGARLVVGGHRRAALDEGIGDTIRVSLTPGRAAIAARRSTPARNCCRRSACAAFAPSVTACPGCGRTTSTTFQELAERVQEYIREQMPEWKTRYEGVETLTLAVMGCVVNGPGESKAANIGISLPGTGEAPTLPRVHRRRARHDAARHLRGTGGGVPRADRRLRRAASPRVGDVLATRMYVVRSRSPPSSPSASAHFVPVNVVPGLLCASAHCRKVGPATTSTARR
jgi:hypothetical protein